MDSASFFQVTSRSLLSLRDVRFFDRRKRNHRLRFVGQFWRYSGYRDTGRAVDTRPRQRTPSQISVAADAFVALLSSVLPHTLGSERCSGAVCEGEAINRTTPNTRPATLLKLRRQPQNI